ncbi:DnaX DNA polymerase III, gamma/tau subunits [Oxalobacteraceae bacterium]
MAPDMSYQVLARKYRPKNFDSLVGQEHVVRALTHALEQKRLHHAYLFTGTRGVGKTTLSRILAKSLNCQGSDGQGDITAHPCGVCEACVAIDAGRFVDYIEMDAASNRGVDDMAQLLEQAVYAPSNARFKVYMIDEVHMLSSQAFNSMLKTLEEPPEHVKFILATTDPQKIPVTVLSRCLQFNLKQMAPAGIVTHLESILAQEQISFESPALRLLAQGAQGSMRDALSLTDQAIAYAAGRVTLDAVQGMLGALDHSYLVGLLDALSAQDGVALLAVADDMATRSLSFSNALQDLGTLLNRIAIAQTVPAAIPDELPEREDVLRLASVFTPEDVQLCYQIVVHGRNELGLAPDEYAGFTMTLLRMLAFAPVSTATAGVSSGKAAPQAAPQAAPRVAPLVSAAKQAAAPFPSTRAAPVEPSVKNTTPDKKPVGPAMAALAAARGGKAAAKAVAPQDDFLSEPAADLPVHDSAEGDTAQKKTEQPAEIVTTAPENVSTPALAGAIDWPALVRQLPLKGVAQQLATQSELLGSEDAEQLRTMKLRVPVETLLSAGSADKLAAALSDYFEKTVRLETEIGNVTRTAHAASVAEQARRQQLAEQTLNDDPFVQTLIREFGATIVPGSIKPV